MDEFDEEKEMGELELMFDRATSFVAKELSTKLSSPELLTLYGRYKQATEGTCTSDRPSGWFDAKSKQKWDAWNSLGDMDRETAMQEYLDLVFKFSPEFENNPDNKQSSRGLGFSVSRMQNEDIDINDEDKTVFDWVKEGCIDRVKHHLSTTSILDKDEDGLTILHWAADRGSEEMVDLIVDSFPKQINCVDNDGQTPLHYAGSCGHAEVVKLLLARGADSSVKDFDGVDCSAYINL